jgi:hypothetical protein
MYRAAGRMWTDTFNEKFEARYGFSPAPFYPALWYDIGPQTRAARNYLFGFRAELYASAYFRQVQEWADGHGPIYATGHQDQEEVVNPVSVSGDLMKCFKYIRVPGVDKIGGNRPAERFYKIISSAAYNWDNHLVMSETYGAMGNLSWEEIYAIAMEQYTKGINMLIPHAVWYDDGSVTFLPELSYRSPIYGAGLPQYNDYLGRLNLMLQNSGRHVADIAVLYPIATLQAGHYLDGPLGAYAGGVAIPEADYMDIGELLAVQLGRDYTWLHPEVLDSGCTFEGNMLRLNNQVQSGSFKVLIVPAHKTIHWSSLKKIRDFYDNGGQVIATGALPSTSAEFGHDSDVVAAINHLFAGAGGGIGVTASSQWTAGGYEPARAADGSPDTRWNSADGSGGNQWLEIDFGENTAFNTTITREAFNRVSTYSIQYWDGSNWMTCASGTIIGAAKTDTFGQVTATKVRLFINAISAETNVSIYEFEVYLDDGPNLALGSTETSNENQSGGRAVFLRTPNANSMRQALDDALDVYDVEFENNAALRYIHKVVDGEDRYFFANLSGSGISTFARLRGRFIPTAWDPHTGETTGPGYTHETQSGYHVTRVQLDLQPVRSMFITGTKDAEAGIIPVLFQPLTLDNFPNPFRYATTVKYSVPGQNKNSVQVDLHIYNTRGGKIKTLISGPQMPGKYSVRWNGRDFTGRKMSPGPYICTFTVGKKKRDKILLLQ